jgi:hypothetical protein
MFANKLEMQLEYVTAPSLQGNKKEGPGVVCVKPEMVTSAI